MNKDGKLALDDRGLRTVHVSITAIKTIRRLQVGQVDTTIIKMVAAWKGDTLQRGRCSPPKPVTFNHGVAGSSPAALTKKSKG